MPGRTIPVVFGAIVAAGFSQFPEYSQQYAQRVGGAYEEVHAIAERFRADAEAAGKNVDAALATYAESGDQFLTDRGLSMREVLDREVFLERHYAAVSDPDGYNRLFAFAMARDDEIAAEALEIYRPALPLTFVGGAYAALGFLVGYFLLRAPFMLFRRRRPAAEA